MSDDDDYADMPPLLDEFSPLDLVEEDSEGEERYAEDEAPNTGCLEVDVNIVVQATRVSEEDARKALEKTGGNVYNAIYRLMPGWYVSPLAEIVSHGYFDEVD